MPVLVKVRNLKKYFPVKEGFFHKEKKRVHAVDDVSFDIREGEALGLVGESGCGKTTTAKIILRLLEPTAGTVEFMGEDIFKLDKNKMNKLRSQIQIVFQDPFGSLNPRKTVGQILAKPYKLHGYSNIEKRILELLKVVGLDPPEMFMDRYPHELSGGQRQRIGVARALALRPKLVVADEPVSDLDVSVEAKILNLMKDLQENLSLTYLFISHDLSVVRSMCDRVAVMYLGKIVELADAEELYRNPAHVYTKALISSIPAINPKSARDTDKIELSGEVPSPIDPPSGCRFHPRCPYKKSVCIDVEPKLVTMKENHLAACHLVPESLDN